jgi:hypothetical protein
LPHKIYFVSFFWLCLLAHKSETGFGLIRVPGE